MTDKEVLTMAGQYGLWINGDMLEITDDALIEFVRAIEKEEREACAKLVKASCSGMEDDGLALAQLIRARGES